MPRSDMFPVSGRVPQQHGSHRLLVERPALKKGMRQPKELLQRNLLMFSTECPRDLSQHRNRDAIRKMAVAQISGAAGVLSAAARVFLKLP